MYRGLLIVSGCQGRSVWAVLVALGIMILGLSGCNNHNCVCRKELCHKGDPLLCRTGPAEPLDQFLKRHFFYPVRDAFDGELQISRLLGRPKKACNTDWVDGYLSSLFTPRDIAVLTVEQLRRGPNETPPEGPFKVVKEKTSGASAGFFGKDAEGLGYVFKLDVEGHEGLGSSAAAIASRLYWALGYRVPVSEVVTIDGTGKVHLDGRRGEASPFVAGEVLGSYKADWFRDCREVRALKLAAAWLNDPDRADNNNLVAVADGIATFYLIDFNSALGAWQGRPKPPWRGFRHRWDPGVDLVKLLTLGLVDVDRTARPGDHLSDRLGYLTREFEPDAWRDGRPHSAFARMTEEDGRWMAARIEQFSRGQLEAVVAAGQLGDPADEARLVDYLVQRQRVIVERYLGADQPASASISK